MTRPPWPLPFPMESQELDETLIKLEPADLRKVILALAKYHVSCNEARNILEDDFKPIFGDTLE